MPWKPHYTEHDAREAIEGAGSWVEVLDALGYVYHGKNVQTVRNWAARWGISVEHLPVGIRHRYVEKDVREAVAASRSWTEAFRRLGFCQTGGNPKTLKKRVAEWGIPTDHFGSHPISPPGTKPKPLAEILIRGSTYSRSALKARLFSEGLKKRECELCGQGELWRGKPMALILDHKNGVRDDNRLENLQIVCPNCSATLDTHCGRKNRVPVLPRNCLHCGAEFQPKTGAQRYCSRYCGTRWDRTGRRGGPRQRGVPNPRRRKVERPPHKQLMREIEATSYLAVGRKYGVSDTAIRRWVRFYEGKPTHPESERPMAKRQLQLLEPPLDDPAEGLVAYETPSRATAPHSRAVIAPAAK